MSHDSSDRLNVLLVLGAFQLRGSSARAMSLVDRLPKERLTLRLVSTCPVQIASRQQPPLEVRISRYLNWPVVGSTARRFLRLDLRKAPPDVIDIQHRSMHGVGAWLARRLQRPYTVTVHDYLADRERFVIDPTWCRRVVAVSESVRSELLERTRLPEDLVTVIPSGVTPPDESQLGMILSANRCPVIGTAGPLEAGKGLQHFLRAAVRVAQKYPQAMFVIAGSGPEERSLRTMAHTLGLASSLTILPNLRDFGPALQAMDVFVLPALKQGLASTMLDAMARGLPVIGTESGGVYSVIVDGVTGVLTPPSDDLTLAERIDSLLQNPERAREMGRAARQRVIDHFHVSQMVKSTASLYRELARPRR